MTKITLTDEETDRIEQFVDEMLEAGKTTKCGTTEADFRDAYSRGKGAEMSVARLLTEQTDLDPGPSVDLDVYQGSDDTDLPPYRAEVKVIPSYGSWCAIPRRKFNLIDSDEPIIIVKDEAGSSYDVAGWTMPDDCHVIEQGEKPFTQISDNYCRRLSQCSSDWDELANEMAESL